MAEPVVNAPGYTVAPYTNKPFDPFHVITWSPFIDQDDARMISFDLRCELESAFDVHPYSAQCRQSVVKSLLLWAALSRAQRAAFPWNGETNIQLGQNLVQHLLDLTAELNGVSSDAIHAALQAERHPFLKKMHEMMRIQGKTEGEWRGRGDRVASEAPRSTTYAISPAPQREPSTQAPLRAPTVLAESLARDEAPQRNGGAPAPIHVAVAVDDAPPESAAEESRWSALPPPPVAPKPEPPTPAPVKAQPPLPAPTKAVTAQPPTPNAAKAPSAAARPPPPSFEMATQKSKSNGHAAPPPPPHIPPPAHAVTRETLVRKVVPPPQPAAPAPAAAAAKAAPVPPAAVKNAPQPKKAAPAAPFSPPAAKKAVAAPPPKPQPQPVVHPKKQYTYTDSEESSVSSEDAADSPPTASLPQSMVPTPAPATNGSVKAAPTAVLGEAELLRYGADGPEDLLQACWSDVAADPDGLSAWFDRKLAVTESDRKVPLCVEVPSALSVEKVKARMEPRVAKRLEQLFQYLSADAPVELLRHEEAAAFLSIADVDRLSTARLIRPSKQTEGPDTVIAFSVVDKAEKDPSRRFLSWPCGSNRSALDDGYEPHVPLHHISSYLAAVNAASGCAETLMSSFDQVELPPNVQERFVFTDAAKRRWCLTRLPMTHTIAAEVMHILLSTLCGHPSYAQHSFAISPEVRSDVWVRTVRFYGTQAAVAQARNKLRAACKECGATLQPQATDTSGVYNFAGVHFDHDAHSVSVEPEMVRRIAAPRQSTTTRDLERHYTQLLFSASVLGVAVSRFYKLLRTVCWRLSAALENPDTLLKVEPLPADSYAQLEKWHKSVLHNAPRQVKTESLPNMTLYVELSSESWFSVLIGEESQETWNTGGSLEDVLGTKVACAAISKAVECFQPCIEKGSHVRIQILGGNVMSRNDKPIYRNEPKEVIDDCIRTHLVTRTFSFEVEYCGLNEGKGNGTAAAHSKPAYKGKWA